MELIVGHDFIKRFVFDFSSAKCLETGPPEPWSRLLPPLLLLRIPLCCQTVPPPRGPAVCSVASTEEARRISAPQVMVWQQALSYTRVHGTHSVFWLFLAPCLPSASYSQKVSMSIITRSDCLSLEEGGTTPLTTTARGSSLVGKEYEQFHRQAGFQKVSRRGWHSRQQPTSTQGTLKGDRSPSRPDLHKSLQAHGGPWDPSTQC